MEKVRTFVAINLSSEMKERLMDVQQRLRRSAPPETVRWVRPQGIHLTLKFLGEVPASQIPQITAALREACRVHTPFTFTVGGVGCFPNPRSPRVVWVGVEEESGALVALQKSVEKAMTQLGFPRESRPFHPHLTLGRTRKGLRNTDRRRLGDAIATAGVGLLGEVSVDAVYLMRSDLRPSGAVYTALAEARLEGERAP